MTTTVNGLDEIKALSGRDLGNSEWLEITQQRVNTFADATDDHQWIHVDTERAKDGPFGTTIAHGYLTVSLLIPMLGELLQVEGVKMAINMGMNKLRFPSPVPVGSKIRAHGEVTEVVDVKGDGVQLSVDLTVEVQGGDKPACLAQALYRYYA